MPTNTNLRRAICVAVMTLGFVVATPSISAPPGPPGPPAPPGPPVLDNANSYQVENLVSLSSGSVAAPNHDVNLKNGWGVAFNPTGFVWVSDNGTGKSTLYDGNGNPSPPPTATPPGPLIVTIPAASGNPADAGSPTGIVFNASNDFQVTNGVTTGPARFLWASEDGMISGWAPNVDGTHALKGVVNPNAVYKGIAIAGNGSGNFFLYAADLIGHKIDVYDHSFAPASVAGGFVDPGIPKNFGPFNIMNIQGNLYVSYAQTAPNSDDEVDGPGLGFVSVFDADGNLLMHLAKKGKLNAPWGIALAPQGFGRFSNDVLVANFGDGTINAFDPRDGHSDGQLKTSDGKTLVIPGLWGIAFGNGILNQQTDTLFFAAGPSDESDGVYGRIDLVAPMPPMKGPKGDGM